MAAATAGLEEPDRRVPARRPEFDAQPLPHRPADPPWELGDGTLTWLESGPGILTFRRESLVCVTNLTPEPVDLPPHEEVVLTSTPLDDGRLPSDSTAWIR